MYGAILQTQQKKKWQYLFSSSGEALPELDQRAMKSLSELKGTAGLGSLIQNVSWLALWSLLLTLLLIIHTPIETALVFSNSLILDYFTFACQVAVLLAIASTILMNLTYFQQGRQLLFEWIILLLFSTLSMLLMVSAYDLITLYLTIELQSLCFYVMAASKRDSEFSTEAGLKYFLLGAFSSGILLFGCSLIYGFTGVTNFEELAKISTGYEITLLGAQSSGIYLGIFLIAVGFLFKITAAPFHMWAPDVYEGSPTSVTALFSIVPKIALLAVMVRIFIIGFYDPRSSASLLHVFFFCSIFSMILGSIAAMAQTKIKRLLAYSSIGHVGYLLIGLACGTSEGIQALLIGLFIYVWTTINVFAVILSTAHPSAPKGSVQLTNTASKLTALPQIKNIIKEAELEKQVLRFSQTSAPASTTLAHFVRQESQPFYKQFERTKLFLELPVSFIADFGALAKTNPILAITMAIVMFSYAGIPPLAGFYSKYYLFEAAIGCGAYLVTFIGVITSVIACFYYIRLVKIMYFDKPQTWILYRPINQGCAAVLAITLFLVTFFFFYPSPLFLLTHQMALNLCL
uniref:NADH dehydrogenase subunit 2 n=1 Tax=Coleochaete scutata TaxID=3125 RepID=A0A5P9NW42_COLSC|nr:NADH dehydrogenase subunit 2 [Coleochaete scutata]QFU80172.1 NADH dehydrogenase subunit 2 [Coleochaete scutata]